jgi:tRNA(Arg) A34 adenosine deaminase TadA
VILLPFGRIDPAYLLAAYALEEGNAKSFSITKNYELSPQWQMAFHGIANLAEAQQKSLTMRSDAEDVPTNRQFVEVQLAVEKEDPATKAEPIIDNIFVPDPNSEYGTRSIPRLYMMAAITVEAKMNASVVALIVDQKGTIVSQGIKYHGEGGCGHAEVRAILKLQGILPTGGAFLTTLKPCTMCASLIYAVDENGGLVKYWARDDAAGAADWSKIALRLPNSQALDAKCKHARFLKLPDGKDFATEFEDARSRADKESRKPLDRDVLFSSWLSGWKPPQGISFVERDQTDSNKGRLAAIRDVKSVKGIKDSVEDMHDLLNRKLARGTSPKGNVQGLEKPQMDDIKSKFEKYCVDEKKKITPGMGSIEFISGKYSSALRGTVMQVLKRKAEKYQHAEYGTANAPAKQRNTKIVFEYLAQYLQQMGCTF